MKVIAERAFLVLAGLCVLLTSACAPGHGAYRDGVAAMTRLDGHGEARLAFEEACLAGHPTACYRYDAMTRTRRITDSNAFTTATSPLEGRCQRGEARGCFELALFLDDDAGMPLDGARAFELYKAACDGGYPYACFRVGIFYRVSVPSREPDAPAQALDYFEKACEAGYAEPCRAAAQLLSAEPSLGGTRARRVALEELACGRGAVGACFTLATAIEPRAGEAEEEKTGRVLAALGPALEVLTAACEESHPRACRQLGDLWLAPELGFDDAARARAQYRRACDGEDPIGCKRLAEMVREGRGGASNAAAAKELEAQVEQLLRRQCEAGYTQACWEIAR